MRKAVSLSLGTSRRNFRVSLELFGQRIEVERVGCDGSLARLAGLLQGLDGEVEALGLGGMNFAYRIGGKVFPVVQAVNLYRLVHHTPLVDGSYLKDTVERWLVDYLAEEYGFAWSGLKVLVISALDRFGLAEELSRRGARVFVGDAYFALRIPVIFPSLRSFSLAADLFLPVLRRLPLTWLYPLGKKQEKPGQVAFSFYRKVQVIAGDFHFLWRYLPANLKGKIVITSSLWPEEREVLRARGVACLVTPMPAVNGCSWAANVWEAALTAALGRPLAELGREHFRRKLEEAGLRPRVEVFYGKENWRTR